MTDVAKISVIYKMVTTTQCSRGNIVVCRQRIKADRRSVKEAFRNLCGHAVALVCTLVLSTSICSCDKVSSSLTASARVYFQVCSGSYLGVGTTAVFKRCRLLHPPVVRHPVLPGRSRPFLSPSTPPSSLRLPCPSSFLLPTFVPVPSLLS